MFFPRWRAPLARALMLTFLACAFAGSIAALAKEHADIKGVVRSQDGSPVAGALVIIDAGDFKRSATSDAKGRFKIKDVKPETYVVTVVARGYATVSGRTIDAIAGKDTSLELTLERETTGSMAVIGEVT